MKTGFLIDLDGTLYRGKHILPGARELLAWLEAGGYPYALTTNCPLHSPQTMQERLAGLEINVRQDRIITSGMICAAYLRELGIEKDILALGSEAYRQWLLEDGFTLCQRNAKAVVVAYDPRMTYEDLQRACREVEQGAFYLLTNQDASIPLEDGNAPHTGAIGAAISFATGKNPVVTGKPHPFAMAFAARWLDCSPEECLVIGDRLDTDMAFARENGAKGWLVLTGATSRVQAQAAAPAGIRVFEGLPEILDHLQKTKTSGGDTCKS